MKKAFIDPIQKINYNGKNVWTVRQIETSESIFPIGEPFFWVDCNIPEINTTNSFKYYYDPELKDIFEFPKTEAEVKLEKIMQNANIVEV